jgi:hypothetical protein
MGIFITIQNRKSRPVGYMIKSKTKTSWASKNMLALGLIVSGLLVIHLSHFWAKMQLQRFLGNEGENHRCLTVLGATGIVTVEVKSVFENLKQEEKSVEYLLFLSQLLAFRLLYRLINPYSFRPVP